MDFETAITEVSKVEKDAVEYVPVKPEKKKMERLLEVSSPDIHELEYQDIVTQYGRLEKIIAASARMDIGVGEKKTTRALPIPSPEPAPAALKKEAKAIEKEIKKISEESAKETKEMDVSAPLEAPPEEPHALIAGPESERAKAEETARVHHEIAPAKIQEVISEPEALEPSKEAKEPIKTEEKKEEIIEAPKEAEPEGVAPTPEDFFEKKEEAEITKPAPQEESMPISSPKEIAPVPKTISTPTPEEMPKGETIEKAALQYGLQIEYPPILATSPLAKADETISRLETQLAGQMTGKTTKKVDTKDTKKRMMELTRELFKERSMDRRAEIKKEIVALKGLLSETKGGKAAAGGLPKGSLFNALKTEQGYELRNAKNKIQAIYEENQKRIIEDMRAQRAMEHRGPAFETFSKNIVELEHVLMDLISKYQVFLIAEHTAELSKLAAHGQATDESKKLKTSLKELYSHEFSSLKESIGEEIHSQLDTTRAALFEKAGDPQAVNLAQIANAHEDSLFNLLQAKDPRAYEKYARGETDRSEALLLARKIMAKEAGIDEDTIIKRFGGK